MSNRDEWAAEAISALRSVVVLNKRKGDPAPRPVAPRLTHERPRITARDWLAILEQRKLDLAYTQSVAAEIALRRLMTKGDK